MIERRLSPSRASTFKRCGQLFKFKYVAEIEEPRKEPAATGQLVHATLEELMQLAPGDRRLSTALQIADTLSRRSDTEYAGIADLKRAEKFVGNYFELEDPTSVDPKHLELSVETHLGGLKLSGIIDRIDEDGSLVDYKTGRTPSAKWESSAFFGLRFYAVVIRRTLNYTPPKITLLYLASKQSISIEPHEAMLNAFERQLQALDAAIVRARTRDDFRPRPGGLCEHCPYIDLCPAWKDEDPSHPWLASRRESA